MASLIVVSGVVALAGGVMRGAVERRVGEDALARQVLGELDGFTDWLARNDARGYVGEVGWPGSRTEDGRQWQGLAERWYAAADAADLWVTAWTTGESWSADAPLMIYVSPAQKTPLTTARAQAEVVEAQAPERRGVNVSGGEFGQPPSTANISRFSNASPGAYDDDWHYDSQGSFDYLASRDVTTVRLAFRWERVQPRLGAPLDPEELARLRAAVARAHAAGLGIVLNLHNYGGYYLFDGTQGVRRAVGSPQVPIEDFADVWRRLATAFADEPGVIGYGLMNEPRAMDGEAPARVWEQASQAALEAIRDTGDDTLVLVPGYDWADVESWPRTHPRAWIADPADNHRYEGHHYWDRDHSGDYRRSYADELAAAGA